MKDYSSFYTFQWLIFVNFYDELSLNYPFIAVPEMLSFHYYTQALEQSRKVNLSCCLVLYYGTSMQESSN